MQVTHVSFSPLGGAGVVARTLKDQQTDLSYDVNTIFASRTNLWKNPLENPMLTINSTIDQYLLKNDTAPTQFSLLRNYSRPSILESHQILGRKNLHFHWMEGIFNVLEAQKLIQDGVNLVWTLHDMAPFTGGCHHSFECIQFTLACESCPQVKSMFRRLPANQLAKKAASSGIFENIKFAAPSRWLQERATSSKLLRNSQVELIPNPIRPIFFQNERNLLEKFKTSEPRPFVFAVVASNLRDKNKNIRAICEAFLKAIGETEMNLKLQLIGDGGENYSKLHPEIYWQAAIDSQSLVSILDKCDVVISGSAAESFSLVIAEGQARGLKVIVPKGSATAELVAKESFGTLFDEIQDLAASMIKVASKGTSIKDSLEIMNHSLKFRPELAAQFYEKLYELEN